MKKRGKGPSPAPSFQVNLYLVIFPIWTRLMVFRVGEKLLVLAARLDFDQVAVLAFLCLDPGLEIFQYDRDVHDVPDRHDGTVEPLFPVGRFPF